MRDEKHFAVYIMTNCRRGVLYTGVTSNLPGRVWKHREGALPGFTQTWGLKRLVWYEDHGSAEGAITREKRIKRWRRAWKFALIEAKNPEWTDLWPEITGQNLGPRLV
jgi:putative endonuclease